MRIAKRIAYISACVFMTLVILLLVFLMAAPAMFDARDTVADPPPRLTF